MRPIDYFFKSAKKSPDSIFLIDDDSRYSYRQSSEKMLAIAGSLHKSGLRIGDSVAVYSPNNADAVICLFAAICAGGAWVPINIRNSPTTNAEYMAYVRTKCVFFHSSLVDDIQRIESTIPGLNQLVCIDKSTERYPSVSEFCNLNKGGILPDWSDPAGVPGHIFSRWPTGGTTGPSKGVEMTNGNIVTMFELGVKHYLEGREEDIVHLAVAPITHAAGLMIGIFSCVVGTTVVRETFDPMDVLNCIETYKVTHIFLPPTAYYALLEKAKLSSFDLSSLRQILIAAAPVSPAKLQEGVEVFGPVVCQCYGQAEVPMLVSMLSPKVLASAVEGQNSNRLRSCGEISSCTEVVILDEEGNQVEVGERGEICCRGPLVTPGYFEKPEATAEIREGGWHHTGDIGYLDSSNFLYIVDRKKDMIISGGFNVFATEVEAPILELNEVLECAVVGVPDEKWGELVMAFVVLKTPNTISAKEIIERVKPKLGSVKIPKSVEFWDQIPKTPVGKTDKKAIRKKFWEDMGRSVN